MEMRIIGLDIGSNSVGSAWVDTDMQDIRLGVSVFPAGVEERDDKRGAPKNQKRRQTRSQRRGIRRRALRKRRLRKLLVAEGLLPHEPEQLRSLFGPRHEGEDFDLQNWNPWILRREGLHRELTPFEFGRVLVHLNQRRGAWGITTNSDESDEGKVKDAIDRTRQELNDRVLQTYGELMATLLEERFKQHKPIRNRRDSFEFHADRGLIEAEFQKLWNYQCSYQGKLAALLTDELLIQLDNPGEDNTWRHKGEIFGQRRTYWKTGTLGRCDLEPTDHQCPIVDMYAQEYRVIESVNNIRIKSREESEWRPLTDDERQRLIHYLRGGSFVPKVVTNLKRAPKPKRAVKSPKPEHIREVLGIDKKTLAKQGIPEDYYQLNLENDPDREINTDWFYRSFAHEVFGEQHWQKLSEKQRESVNRAILKFNPDIEAHALKLRKGAMEWWGLSAEGADKLILAWKDRPDIEKRLKLSRRAIRNLLPHMNEFDSANNRWPTQIEARKRFSETSDANVLENQRKLYTLDATPLNKASRHFLRKHPDLLPPAPMISNPVVRKAIHEVRRHLHAYRREFKSWPDRVVIEFVRGVKNTAKQRNLQLAANRKRERERKEIESDLAQWKVPKSNWKMAVLRVRLCKEQSGTCPFSVSGRNASKSITPRMAAEGKDVEIEHIIPEAITGKTMDFNNIVLCFREVNRNKGKRTPLDWLGASGIAEILRRLEDTPLRNNVSKWGRLQIATPDPEEYRSSQLTDTAYAARQVADYIKSALWPELSDGKRRLFTTKGDYTARLRADWGLYESDIDKENGLETPLDEEALREDPSLVHAMRRARKDPTKDRIDHRHHALDALVVALTPDYVSQIGEAATRDREYYERVGKHPRRTPVGVPWNEFRANTIAALDKLIVCHRPERRRITGSFHKETSYGKAEEYPGLYTERMPVAKLKSTQLIEPVYDSAAKVWKIPGQGQGRAIRDPSLRKEIIICLRQNGVDPESFTDSDIKLLTESNDWKLRTATGYPIKSVTVLLAMTDPVSITGKDGVERHFMGGSNHHMEILSVQKSGNWIGLTIPTFVAAKRNAARLRALKKAGVPSINQLRRLPKNERRKYRWLFAETGRTHPIVDRTDREGKQFVLSLAIGEMLFLKHKETKQPGFFIVYKLDDSNVFLNPHWDARRAKGKGVDNPREQIQLSPRQIQALIVDPERIKAAIDPLGRIRWLIRD
jgi:CRISPR-associated endonuclease Csn1